MGSDILLMTVSPSIATPKQSPHTPILAQKMPNRVLLMTLVGCFDLYWACPCSRALNQKVMHRILKYVTRPLIRDFVGRHSALTRYLIP